jgi:hypothetical protein
MLVYHRDVYASEMHIQQTADGLQHLRYWRLGLVTPTRPNDIGSLGPYKIVVAYAARTGLGPQRVAYLNLGGAPRHIDGLDPDHESDNLITPASFLAGEPSTIEPTHFGRTAGGHVGTIHHQWIARVIEAKRMADISAKRRGLRPLDSSFDRWGVTYDAPTH